MLTVDDWLYRSGATDKGERICLIRCTDKCYVNQSILYDATVVHESCRPISQIPQCSCAISHNSTFTTKMYTFLFRMAYCGIWSRCIVVFVRSAHCRTGDVSIRCTKYPMTNAHDFVVLCFVVVIERVCSRSMCSIYTLSSRILRFNKINIILPLY